MWSLLLEEATAVKAQAVETEGLVAVAAAEQAATSSRLSKSPQEHTRSR
jgi:hypothetical protein